MSEVVVLTDSSLAANGSCARQEDRPAIWYSDSGADWARVLEPVGSTFYGIAPDGIHGGLLIAANEAGRPAVWRGDPRAEMEIVQLPTTGKATVEHVATAGDKYLAVGFADFGNGALAWQADANWTDWRPIEVPRDAMYFEQVLGDNAAGSFTVAGGLVHGARTWDLEPDGTWSADHEGIRILIDTHTGLGLSRVWRRQNGFWHDLRIRPEFDVISGARLKDGWIVGGWPAGMEPHPFAVLIARNGGAWRELPRLDSGDPQIIDMTQMAGRIIGVGDAVYVGPDTTRGY